MFRLLFCCKRCPSKFSPITHCRYTGCLAIDVGVVLHGRIGLYRLHSVSQTIFTHLCTHRTVNHVMLTMLSSFYHRHKMSMILCLVFVLRVARWNTVLHTSAITYLPLPIVDVYMKSLVAKQLPSILHVSHFILFSLKSMNRLDVMICWFSLYLIAEKSTQILFYEIKLGKKVEPNYHIAQIVTLLHI